MPIHLTCVLYQSKQSIMKSLTQYILGASENTIHEVPHKPQNPKTLTQEDNLQNASLSQTQYQLSHLYIIIYLPGGV